LKQTRSSNSAGGDAREEFVLALLLQHSSLREGGLALSEDLFWDAQARQLLAIWRESGSESVKDAMPPEMEEYFERLYSRRLPVADAREAAEALEDCIRKLHDRRLRAEKEATASQIADLQDEVGVLGILGPVEQEILERDTEIGKQIHRQGRSDGTEAPIGAAAVETSANHGN
jgi:hypothetical protein